jgi:predicted dehydrogenase
MMSIQKTKSQSTPPDVSAYLSVPYQPRWPSTYRPPVALIGCGSITRHHLQAYRSANLPVVALCDLDRQRAEQRQREFYPEAQVYTDYRDVLRRDEIQVVDIATHPAERPPIVAAALRAGKHVLSQKPFVTDLSVGRRLVRLAEKHNVLLAVNQNGRWAPHWSYLRTAISRGLFGTVSAVALSVHWNHGWIAGTPFEKVRHVILFDYAIHWFDILRCFLPGRPVRRVYASLVRSVNQSVSPALLAQVSLELDDALASLVFHADTRCTSQDRTIISGSHATAISVGPNEKVQTLNVHLSDGAVVPKLQGCWFPDGFAGTMGELLCAIEERRQPSIAAEDNLRSLELCFAAVASAERGQPLPPGRVRRIDS